MKSDSPLPLETEATLVVCSEDPSSVAAEIARLKAMGDYTLQPRGLAVLRDIYFLEGPLKPGFAIRIRDTGRQVLLALKGPPTKTDWGAIQRMEIEAPWSKEAVQKITDEIGDGTIAARLADWDFEQDPAPDIMLKLGLRAVQSRETRRQARHVLVSKKKSVEVIAELAIDSVTYHFDGQDVRHYEVEVEEKTFGRHEQIRDVLDHLITKFGIRLREWDQDKLSTGMAIQEILRRGEMRELLTADNAMTPAAYDKLDRYFATERL